MDSERRTKLEATTRYDPAEVEERIYAGWDQRGYFTPAAEGTPEENFSIAIPPPNVTGSLHMGHGLNNTIQDTLVRKQRMAGRRAKWIIGTDHAGIATQSVVEKELRKEGVDRHELGREGFVERVWEWREQYGGRIIELGAHDDLLAADGPYAALWRRRHSAASFFFPNGTHGLLWGVHEAPSW